MDNKIKLDKRLSVAASFVRDGLPVADIGCDHGKLAVHLALTGKVPKVIATDLNSDPLAKAKIAAEQANCTNKVELRLGDGLCVLSENEVGTIIVAGLSAQTIIEVLEKAPWLLKQNSPRLVLVPVTKHPTLRKWLLEKGFELVRDYPLEAAGKWYTVMVAEYTGVKLKPQDISIEQMVYGKTQNEEYFAPYALRVQKHLKKKLLGLKADEKLAKDINEFLQKQKDLY